MNFCNINCRHLWKVRLRFTQLIAGSSSISLFEVCCLCYACKIFVSLYSSRLDHLKMLSATMALTNSATQKQCRMTMQQCYLLYCGITTSWVVAVVSVKVDKKWQTTLICTLCHHVAEWYVKMQCTCITNRSFRLLASCRPEATQKSFSRSLVGKSRSLFSLSLT